MTSLLAVLVICWLQILPTTFAEQQKEIYFREERRFQDTRSNLDSYNYKSYLSFPKIEERLRMLQKAFPNKVRLEVVGQSVEGRDLHLVIITDDVLRSEVDMGDTGGQVGNFFRQQILPKRSKHTPATSDRKTGKPVIFVDAGIHAREWVSPAAALYLLDKLVETPQMTRDLEWRIMPMVNPDGYTFSKKSSSNRFWRKNRAKTSRKSCTGVDLNRNFDVHWEETNQNPCAETYSGTHPFSEPESRAVRDAVTAVRSRIEAYITCHTYGQLILYPYGYTNKKTPPQVKALIEMGNGMAKAIKQKYGNKYLVRQASVLGAAAGGSDDWALMKMGVPYSYTLELQNKVHDSFNYQSRGFILAPQRLPQAVDECWLALNYLGKQILKKKRQGVRVSEDGKTVLKEDDNKRKLYPVGWRQVIKEVESIRAEARSKGDVDMARDCVRRGTMYVCPHMIFWNSMFGTFRS